MSQEKLAHRADLDHTYVSGIERGRRNPSLKSIARLTEALEIDFVTLCATMQDIAARDG